MAEAALGVPIAVFEPPAPRREVAPKAPGGHCKQRCQIDHHRRGRHADRLDHSLSKHRDEQKSAMECEHDQQAGSPTDEPDSVRTLEPVGSDRHRLSPASSPTSAILRYPAPRSLFMTPISAP